MWLIAIIAGVMVATTVCIVMSFVNFDRLLHIEHDKYHEAWLDDGKPTGFFWIPPDTSTWTGGWARSSVHMAWQFRTPSWLRNDAEAKALLRQMRRVTYIGWAGSLSILPILVAGILLAP